MVALTIQAGRVELVRAADGSPLGDWDGVTTGRLSGDGSYAWLQTADGVYRWAPGEATPVRLTSAQLTETATPLAVDRTGHHGLLRLAKNSLLVAALPPGSLPGPLVGQEPYWLSDAAPMVGWGPPRSAISALVTLGGRTATVYAAPDGLHVDHLPHPAVGRIATGPGEVTALAVDPTGTRLAVGIGQEVAVWSLADRRASSEVVPAYDSDRPDQARDLLNADRDAQAIAALVSARDLHPPLSIGLFGAWGSGESFILDQIATLLSQPDRPDGYLRQVSVVEFNAWHYAEANLWASLVDQVLQAIAPVRRPDSPPELEEAESRARVAADAAARAEQQEKDAQEALQTARERLVQARRRAARLVASVVALLGVAVVAAILGGPGRVAPR